MTSLIKGFTNAVKAGEKDLKKGYGAVKQATAGGGIYAASTKVNDRLTNNIGGPVDKGLAIIASHIKSVSSGAKKDITNDYQKGMAAAQRIAAPLTSVGDAPSNRAAALAAPAVTNSGTIQSELATASTLAQSSNYGAAIPHLVNVYNMYKAMPTPKGTGNQMDIANWIASYYNEVGDDSAATQWRNTRDGLDNSLATRQPSAFVDPPWFDNAVPPGAKVWPVFMSPNQIRWVKG